MKGVWILATFLTTAMWSHTIWAQSAGRTFVRPVSYAHAVELHGVGCGNCVPQGHQFTSPNQADCPWFLPPDAVPCVGVPHGPCCGTIFSEMFCDVKAMWHRMMYCGEGCCGDLRPMRLRDYHMHHICSSDCGCQGGFFSALFTPLLRPFLGCGCHDCYGASTEYGEVWSDGEAWTEEPTPTPAKKEPPENAESLIKPVPTSDQHALRHRTELQAAPFYPTLNPPRQASSSTGLRRLSYEQEASSLKTPAKRSTIRKGQTGTRSGTSPIRFGDSFGKQKSANFGGARFQ